MECKARRLQVSVQENGFIVEVPDSQRDSRGGVHVFESFEGMVKHLKETLKKPGDC